MPDIIPIDVWGGTRNGWGPMTLPAVGIWVHHSVTNATGDAFADFRTLDQIGGSQGHGGISYSWVIHPSGVIGEGQATARGAHTGGQGCGGSGYGWNPCSFGICFVGNFMDDQPTAAAIDSFRWLAAHLDAAGLLAPGYTIGGHRDAPGNSTACPGTNLEALLDELRQPYNPTPIPGDDDMKFFALKKPGTDRVWLCWGMYRTAVPSMDVLSGLQFLGICGAVSDGVPSFIDGLVEIPWGSTPGVAGPAPVVDVKAIAVAVADELARRVAQ